ncbi:DUF5131 family protein [Vampirovibrio chlorellavorus]|uniref:DUF5131 family protein n=1 Tax=Vampirovibrio chlorellavorus TaxID=758823 RepID=UPI0026EB8B54|nr:phage Gp37/Gp68 family protein [Vampirovibrio chlorellavorus]
MSDNSKIEWTDSTWNPVRGCTKISPGCQHCYAETFAERWRGIKGHPYENGFDLRLVPNKLTEPLKWPKSKMIFVNSMSDLFHKDVPTEYIHKVIEVMLLGNWHTYQVLTKRPERMLEVLSNAPFDVTKAKHIWWGVSVENKKHGLPRIELLRKCPVAMRFLSVEPLLEDLGKFNLVDIDWVIVGGESGPGARPMEEAWVSSIQKQCKKSGTAFFFKQWGGVQKSKAGRELNGRTYDEFPIRVQATITDKAVREKYIQQFERIAI